MAIEITMPHLSAEISEGVVLEWHVRPGQRVEKGQVVAEVEADKAVVELEAPAAGVLAFRAAVAGQFVRAGGLIGVLAGEGEDAEQLRQRYAASGAAAAPAGAVEPVYCPQPPDPSEVLREIPLRGMRGAIAARMLRSKRGIPHYQVRVDCDAEGLLEARRMLRKDKRTGKVSLNAIILKCVAAALKEHPMVNSTIVGDVIYQHVKANIGFAVSAPGGLAAPVVRDVGNKSVAELSVELDGLAEAATKRKLRPEELRGGTFTVSTLGSYGVHDFTAIIVPPQVGILAIGTIRAEPVVREGRITAGRVMALTISADHRAVDGAVAAEFLRTLRGLLEDPSALVV